MRASAIQRILPPILLATAAVVPAATKAEVVNLGIVRIGSDVRVETSNQFLAGGLGGLYQGAVQFKMDTLTIVESSSNQDQMPWTNRSARSAGQLTLPDVVFAARCGLPSIDGAAKLRLS